MTKTITIFPNRLTGAPCGDYAGYLVVCRDDSTEEAGVQGAHVLATREVFPDFQGAQDYAATCAYTRDPFIIPCIFALTIERKKK